ncbi:MAG: hypothetical protein OEZ43_19055 [Gammaproteobacteria bacterium]|nr:hypothetical protein [Gammaproteobacteria bacterium]
MKKVRFRNKKTADLDVRAFLMYQNEEAIRGKSGSLRYNHHDYQVTVVPDGEVVFF